MKKLITHPFVMIALVAAGLLSACKKNSSVNTSSNSAANSSTGTVATIAAGNIAIALSSSVKADSVVLMHACTPGVRPDTVAFSALPASVGTYLTANYAGYTKQKAFKVLDRTGALTGYVVVINFNGKPVGLRFDTTGTFVSVLEQRERQDEDDDNPGWHKGGRFDDRDGMHLDTVAISALPTTIKTYFATNYATDTLVHAVVTKDTSYIVFSVNKGMFATAFSSKLAFIKRVQLNPRPVKKHTAIAQSALPVAITTYLTKTYPGYAFDKAFAETTNGVVDRYVVLIDASGTRYGLVFDMSGTFVKSIPVK
ncbi:putative PepSY-like beta-lactamase-inhibitor [Mucilaginibacter yixingensis]|uniref:Putative PepSY-like beta-lactamase-inhibitor n=1 Tax=Mucilaginibacter yixingensis TaxID=1295612 RepID=A0A2T5J5V1_9SPHI|nr:PepSY-like domain-containing protein [Mucilaginibacter yixingensis]PTQ93562.1 putative PepSY-like beta-lactamase-inhibitor [Mucilaginibacter yixingensis]